MRCPTSWSSRWRATASPGRRASRAASPSSKLKSAGPAPNRRGTTVTFHPDPEIFGKHAVPARAPLPHGALEGLPVPRRRDPLALRQEPAAQGRLDSRGGIVPLRGRPQGLPDLRDRRAPDRGAAALRRRGQERDQRHGRRQGRMGGVVAERRGRLRPLLLQHRADRRRRHARIGLPQRPGARPEALRRPHRQPQGLDHHRRRRDRRRGRPGLGVHRAAAVPGPDQGEAGQRRGDQAGRDHRRRQFRALADRRQGSRHRPARARRRQGRGAAAPQAGPRAAAQDRDAQAPPARQARRLQQHRRRPAPRSSWSRAIRPAARPRPRATARPRRSCRCAARS